MYPEAVQRRFTAPLSGTKGTQLDTEAHASIQQASLRHACMRLQLVAAPLAYASGYRLVLVQLAVCSEGLARVRDPHCP